MNLLLWLCLFRIDCAMVSILANEYKLKILSAKNKESYRCQVERSLLWKITGILAVAIMT